MKNFLFAATTITLLSGCQLLSSDSSTVPPEELPQYTQEAGLERYALIHPGAQPAPAVDRQLPAQLQADLWDRIRLQMALDIPQNQLIDSHRDWYLRHPAYIDRIAQRAAPFLHLIVEEIEKRDLPLELVLVPVVESAYDTFAYSHGRASGIWQFIPSTARHYGLGIDWWYDGRRDVMAATTTALDYFDRLAKIFDGDWLLAMAAYNGGQGRVMNAVRRNEREGKPTDFWSLSLPRETRNYVPKILALSELLRDSEEWKVVWPHLPNQRVTDIVDVGQQIDLALAADMAGMSLEELHRYNSGYNRWATAPDGPHTLLLPVERANQFRAALAESDPSDWLAWQRHQVRSGETLSTIAQRYNTTTETIQQFNDINGSLIRRGDYLLIPVASQALERYTLSAEQRLAAAQNRPQGQNKIEHRVQRGDTFWDLARKYKVTVANIARWNNMAPGDMLRPGQTLAIWQTNSNEQNVSASSSGTPVMRTVHYQVRNGDSLALIASRFRVTIADIERWNSISRERYLQPGQRLTLHVDVTKVTL
ncbi:LysM repeat-containing protein [Idiomarina sp. A28L]|uniref:lytic transglycosylase n=1 Tax=Idiomarina sp. A28L TaxID=1036674 RepID=UPI0002138B58|nr:LysM peptidoglycan-binding domain-containing protein [Idiomarina sp. A28L]EGN74320.1 LysM repeat-containing protein [Idiomarina sp. A28L]